MSDEITLGGYMKVHGRAAAFEGSAKVLLTLNRYETYFAWLEAEQEFVPLQPIHKTVRGKLLDLHAHLDSAREVAFAEPIVDFLSILFERPALGSPRDLEGQQQVVQGRGQQVDQDAGSEETAGAWMR